MTLGMWSDRIECPAIGAPNGDSLPRRGPPLPMDVAYTLNPLEDPRWAALVQVHPAASVFHTESWIQALQRTYGFTPIVYTTCSPSAASLTDGILFSAVRSWLTGHRLVSVPFADHCEPLVESRQERATLAQALQFSTVRDGWRYVELRPLRTPFDASGSRESVSASYVLHRLNLRPSLEDIFRGFHPSTIQRKIRRAERESLGYAEGRSEPLLRDFYRLLVLTRRRHGLPPQPIQWFRNLAACFGDRLNIAIALKHRRAIAAMLTLREGSTLVYKYGCSDAAFHSTGAMPFLLWRTIKTAKENAVRVLDLGRSDLDNPGLIAFKNRLGATRQDVNYIRYGAGPHRHGLRGASVPRAIVRRLPARALVTAGRLLYRHLA
jgi:hypothetical protein